MNLSFSSLTGWVSCAMASNSAAIASNLASARLVMPIHDGEARVSFLSAFLVHLIPPSLSKPIGADELEAELSIIRQVIDGIICPRVVFAIGNQFKVATLTILS